MARKARAYVLDTWAVIAYLEDEPSGEKVGFDRHGARRANPHLHERGQCW